MGIKLKDIGLAALSPGALAIREIGRGQRRRRKNEGDRVKNIFTGSVEEGINMFNDMYADDYEAIQSGIGNFSKLASEISQEEANPYLDSVEGKAFANQIEENTDISRQRFSNAASQLNLSDEAVVAGVNNINKAEGDSYRVLSANATRRQNQLRGQKMSALAQILAGQNNLLGKKMNASGQGINYGAGAAGAYNQGFGLEANRQAANTQAFTNLLASVLGSAGQ